MGKCGNVQLFGNDDVSQNFIQEEIKWTLDSEDVP
jgi:hypothetical protein